MSEPIKEQEKRSRGRPKGTTIFEELDLRVLAKFADVAIHEPYAKLAPFLKNKGYDYKDVRRAQIRWRETKQSLLDEARLRRDAAPAESLLGLFAYFYTAGSALAETVTPAFKAINESFEKANRRLAAMNELKLNPGLPIDLSNAKAVEKAIRQFEETVGMSVYPAEMDEISLNELPPSLKLYTAALMIHQLSIQVAENEAETRNSKLEADTQSSEGEK